MKHIVEAAQKRLQASVESDFIKVATKAGIRFTTKQSGGGTYYLVGSFSKASLVKAMQIAGWESQGNGLFPKKEGQLTHWYIQKIDGEQLGVFTEGEVQGTLFEFSGY